MSAEEADELSEFFEAQNIGMSFLSVVIISSPKITSATFWIT